MELTNTHAHTHGIHTQAHTQKKEKRKSRKIRKIRRENIKKKMGKPPKIIKEMGSQQRKKKGDKK